MAIKQEIGLRIADHMGINRQVISEDLQDQYYKTLGNVYERKIGELQPRGGSVLYNTALPSNVSSYGQNFTIYDKILGKTNIMKVGCTAQSQSQLTNANISTAFVVDAAGKWGASGVGIANAFVGCDAGGIQLVATGFGVCRPLNAALVAGLPVSGDTKKLVVTITSTGINDSNITGIDVYASVTFEYVAAAPQSQWIYVGHINLILNPTGTFTFFFGPVTLGADPGSGKAIGGPSSDAAFTLSGQSGLGGSLTPGKTYFVALLSQYINYQANTSFNKCYWAAYSVQSVTLQAGQTAIAVSKTGGGSAASLIAIGTHPHLLQPFSSIVSNSATWSTNFLSMNNQGTAASNQMGCVQFIPTATGTNLGQWIYFASDFAMDEMFARYNTVSSKWEAIGINNFNYQNSDVASLSPPWLSAYKAVSSGADWIGTQYNSQGQDLLYMVPKANWNVTTQAAFLVTGTTTSASATITAMSSTAGLVNVAGRMAIYGAGVPAGTYINAVASSTSVTMVDSTGAAVNATSTNANTPLFFLPTLNQGTHQHNITECDGNVVTMIPIDFGHAWPAQASLITTYKERLIIAGGKSPAFNRCYFSQTIAPYAWGAPGLTTLAQYFQAESGGEEITGISLYTNTAYYTGPQSQFMASKLNTLFVFSDIPVYDGVGAASSVNQATMIQLSKKSGCANHRTIVQTEIGTILTSIDNVWLYRDNGEPVPIGQEISYLLRPEDPSIAIDTSFWSAVYHDGHYKLSYSVNGASAPSQEVWLNIRKMKLQKGQPCWYGPMSGREVKWQAVEERFGDTIFPKRYCVDGTGKNWYQADFESDRQDLGVDITYTIEPHILTFKNANSNRWFTRALFEMKVDQTFSFTETMIMLNASSGEMTNTISRSVSPIVGYVSSNYANFVSACRNKIYQTFPPARLRGENLKVTWTYTGHVLFAMKALSFYYVDEARRVD